MSVGPTGFPNTGVPFVDAQGNITIPWQRFLLALWNRTGGSAPPDDPGDLVQNITLSAGGDDGLSVSRSDDRSLIGLFPADPNPLTTALEAKLLAQLLQAQPTQVNDIVRRAFLLGMAFAKLPEGDAARNYSVVTATVGASPYVYTAPSTGWVRVGFGTVSAIDISRDRGVTFFGLGAVTCTVPVRKLDRVRVTYTAAPDLKFIPM